MVIRPLSASFYRGGFTSLVVLTETALFYALSQIERTLSVPIGDCLSFPILCIRLLKSTHKSKHFTNIFNTWYCIKF